MCSGSEFQIVGATKENERLPLADFMLGIIIIIKLLLSFSRVITKVLGYFTQKEKF